jgi:hypothetical protein
VTPVEEARRVLSKLHWTDRGERIATALIALAESATCLRRGTVNCERVDCAERDDDLTCSRCRAVTALETALGRTR